MLRSRVALTLACAASATLARAQPLPEQLRYDGLALDLQPEFGVTLLAGGRSERSKWLGRLRAGMLVARDPIFVATGAIVEVGGLAQRALGVASELTHLNGLWGRVAAVRGRRAQFGLQLAWGWSWFGLEWQRRFGQPANALLFVVRAPLGIGRFIYGWQRRHAANLPATS